MDEQQSKKAITWLEVLSEQSEYDSQADQYTMRISGLAMSSLRAFLEGIARKKVV